MSINLYLSWIREKDQLLSIPITCGTRQPPAPAGLSANQRPVSGSRDHSRPIRGSPQLRPSSPFIAFFSHGDSSRQRGWAEQGQVPQQPWARWTVVTATQVSTQHAGRSTLSLMTKWPSSTPTNVNLRRSEPIVEACLSGANKIL